MQFSTKGQVSPIDFEQRVMALLGQQTPSGRQPSTNMPEGHVPSR